MTVLPLTYSPDPLLKQVSKPIAEINDEIRELARDMLHTMYAERGIGLAAVQVGQLKRLLVADVEWTAEGPGKQYVLINPEIVENSADINVYKEGCLSFPEQYGDVKRPKTVKVKFQTLDGEWKEEVLEGLLATCVQHEIDHLNGITFVDHLSGLKRDMILRKMKKAQKMGYGHHHVHGPDCNHDHGHDHHHHDHEHGEHCNH